MSLCALRYPHCQSQIHRPAPMREGFVWWRKKSVLHATPQHKFACIRFDERQLSNVSATQIQPFVISNRRTTIQIPIASSSL
jgi:hypothetical protein